MLSPQVLSQTLALLAAHPATVPPLEPVALVVGLGVRLPGSRSHQQYKQ